MLHFGSPAAIGKKVQPSPTGGANVPLAALRLSNRQEATKQAAGGLETCVTADWKSARRSSHQAAGAKVEGKSAVA